jgi:sigma-B regulation protein RsbU (phosphoserine phosphatase)
MKKSTVNLHLNKTQKKIILYILLISIPMLLFSLYFIQNSANQELKKFAKQKAYTIVGKITSEVEHYLNENSFFTKKASYMLKLNPKIYTSILPFLRNELKNNPNIYGSALAIEPNFLINKNYCKYLYKNHSTVEEIWLKPPQYDYLNAKWYSKTKEQKKGSWSKPYFDKNGGKVFMSTYSFPILDKNNHFFGVITADIKVDTLSYKIQNITYSPESFVFILDKEGLLLSHPDNNYALKQTAFDYAKDIHSQTLLTALKKILITDIGMYTATIDSHKYTLYSANMPNSDLKIIVFIKNQILYKPLAELKEKFILITIGGILLILLMILFILKQFKSDIIKTSKQKNELALAKKIQMSFLPNDKDLSTSHFDIHSYLKAAKEVGGDLYGYKELKKSIIFYVGDVSGKGIPAALFMMATQILLENIIDTTDDPAKIISLTNNKLLELSNNGMFATLLVIKYNFSDKKLTFCNAGHPMFIIKTNLLFSPISSFYPPVNAFKNINYKNTFLPISEPFKLICFSDGVTEAENSKQELFGINRVAKTLSIEFSVKHLLKNISMFVKETAANDDMTILMLNFSKKKT